MGFICASSEALYFEARGEPIKGQLAVGEVVLNRVEDPRYPNSICKVINQGTGKRFACQFTYTCDGKLETIHFEQTVPLYTSDREKLLFLPGLDGV